MADEPEIISFSEFLEQHAPGHGILVSDLGEVDPSRAARDDARFLCLPRLNLFCDDEKCGGNRYFSATNIRFDDYLGPKVPKYIFLHYVCSNCQRTIKTFALLAMIEKRGSNRGNVRKLGEFPGFGPPIPAKAINLIGPDRDLFLTGRRAESQGMGIGAFVYYRRVIDNQKDRIFDEIIRVLTSLNPDDPVITELKEAKKEDRFTTAVEHIKHALPQSLFINGYNPLTLLHSALSEGIHNKSDAECLDLAFSVRAVLIEFAIKLGQIIKDDTEIKKAVNRLANKE